jgi:hypothetical protein
MKAHAPAGMPGDRAKPTVIGTSAPMDQPEVQAERHLRYVEVMRRRIGEWLLSAAAVAVLLLIILVIYKPVRDDVSHGLMTKSSSELTSVVYQARNSTQRVAAVALEQSRSHSELVVFAIAAVVLFGFMLRM